MSTSQGIVVEDLRSSDFLSLIRSLSDLFTSCIGPNGGVKILVTGGGVLLTTSTSSRLLDYYVLSHPIAILLSQVIKSQNSTFGDYGLYIGILVSSILEKILKQEIMKQSEANKLLKNISNFISEVIESNSVKLSLDFSTVKQLLPVVKTIVSSKPGCGLSKQNIESLSVQIVKVFLSTINDDFGEIIVVNSSPSEDFRIVDGISYQLETNEVFVQNLLSRMKDDSPKNIPLLLLNIMLTPMELKRTDDEEIIFEDDCNILKEGRTIFEYAVKIGVKIVASQKVVHDSLKLFLQRNNVLLLDRLGSDLCSALKKLSGARVVSSLGSSSINNLSSCLGTVEAVNFVSFHHHSYVSLQKKQGNVATLFVSCSSEEAFMETKVVVQQALRGLRQITCQPFVLPGAGCFESWLAAQLSVKCPSDVTNKKLLRPVLGWIQKSFLSMAGLFVPSKVFKCLDTAYYHNWSSWNPDEVTSCSCGLVNSVDVQRAGGTWLEPDIFNVNNLAFPYSERFVSLPLVPGTPNENNVIDVYISKCNALKVALDICSSILSVGIIVHKPV